MGAAVIFEMVPATRVLTGGAYFAGAALLGAGLVAGRPNAWMYWRTAAWFTAVVVVYLNTQFAGYGRLVVVSLVLLPALLLGLRMPDRRLKVLLLVGAPLLVSRLSQVREEVVAAAYGSDATLGGDSPDSTVSPLRTFSRLIFEQHSYERGYGETFWSGITVFVPRAWWEGKPSGFGAVLTQELEPNLVPVGHSMAALAQGEWFYNFGWVGLVLMVPVVGAFVRWVDRGLEGVHERVTGEGRRIVVVAALALVIAGLPDLVWNGTGTYVTRLGFRLIFLMPLLLLMPRGSVGNAK